MAAIEQKSPNNSPVLERAISAADKAVTSTQANLAECGLFDTALGTKEALSAQMRLEQKRLALLAAKKAETLETHDNRNAIAEVHNALHDEQHIVNQAMSRAVSNTTTAYESARFVHEVGTASVEMATTAVAGPAVGATVGMAIRTGSNVGQSIVEKQIGSETYFFDRLASDATAAAFSFAGGKAGQHTAAAMRATGQKIVSTVGASVAGGVSITTFDAAREVTHRASHGEELVRTGDLKRWTVNATANTATWALGDHSGKLGTSLSPVTKAAVSATVATGVAATAEYVNTGSISTATLAHGISSTLGSAAAAHHLASRNYQVAPITGVKGHMPKDMTPAGYKALSLRSEGGGVASIHLENVGSLLKGDVTVPTIKREFAALMKFAEGNPEIQQVRISSPILARMSQDGGSATLRPLGKTLMKEAGGAPSETTLTPDLQKISITALETARAVSKMEFGDPLRNLGEHEYTAGFTVDVKDPK
jgi:hypothetical protein